MILDPDRRRFTHEVNLFYERSRSMLILIWELVATHWCLQVVGAVGFCRCKAAKVTGRTVLACAASEAMLDRYEAVAVQLRLSDRGRVLLVG